MVGPFCEIEAHENLGSPLLGPNSPHFEIKKYKKNSVGCIGKCRKIEHFRNGRKMIGCVMMYYPQPVYTSN